MFQFLKLLYEKLHTDACISHVLDEIGDDGQASFFKKKIALGKLNFGKFSFSNMTSLFFMAK